MLPIKFFFALIIVALFGTIFLLFSDRFIPQSSSTDFISPAVAGDKQMETAKVETGELTSAVAESVETRAASRPDGPSLLESRCSSCHVTKGLEQFRKSRSEWESTLAQMEAFGVRISGDERVILLDYLSTADNP